MTGKRFLWDILTLATLFIFLPQPIAWQVWVAVLIWGLYNYFVGMYDANRKHDQKVDDGQ